MSQGPAKGAHQLEAVDAAPGIVVGRAGCEGPRVGQRCMHHQQLPISGHRHLQHDTSTVSVTTRLFLTAWLTDTSITLGACENHACQAGMGRSVAQGL